MRVKFFLKRLDNNVMVLFEVRWLQIKLWNNSDAIVFCWDRRTWRAVVVFVPTTKVFCIIAYILHINKTDHPNFNIILNRIKPLCEICIENCFKEKYPILFLAIDRKTPINLFIRFNYAGYEVDTSLRINNKKRSH